MQHAAILISRIWLLSGESIPICISSPLAQQSVLTARVRVSADNAVVQLEAAAVLCCGVLVLLLADGTGSVCVVVCRLLIFEGPNSVSRSRTNPRSIGTRPPAIRVPTTYVVYCTVAAV